MGSLERFYGFKHTVDALKVQKKKLALETALTSQMNSLMEIDEEIQMYSQMMAAEYDFATGAQSRGPRKYLLNKDGHTYYKNPDWVDTRPQWLIDFHREEV